jgi:hypothetical protein
MKHIKLFETFNTKITLELLTDNLTTINLQIIDDLIKISEHYYLMHKNYVKNKNNVRRSEELYFKTNIKGLVGDWKYPFNENITDNEFLLISMKELIEYHLMDKNEMLKLFKIYKKLNPIIKNIPVNNDYMNMYHIMMGMTSGFNYDDIYDFITIGGGSLRDDNWIKKHNIASELLGNYIMYIPSEKTLDKIINHFNK